MRKCVLIITTFLFFSSCEKPDLNSENRLIGQDSITASVLAPFNSMPSGDSIQVSVVTKEEHFLCKRDSGIRNFLAGMCSAPQHFVVNPEVSSEITGQQGTKVFFKPGCFVAKNNRPVLTAVDIKMKECYSVPSMLFENLNARYGSSSFESRGALYLEASCNGEAVEIKDDEPAFVQLPAGTNNNGGFEIYFTAPSKSANVGSNWLPVAKNKSDEPGKPEKVTGDFTKPQFQYQGLDIVTYLHETLQYPEEAKQNELSTKMEVCFAVDAEGKAGNVVTGESFKTFRDEISRVIQTMPDWQAATFRGSHVPSIVHIDIDFNIRRKDQVKIAFNESNAQLIQSASQYYVQCGNVPGEESSEPDKGFAMNQMGWYCCMKNISQKTALSDIIVPDDAKTEIKLLMKKNMLVAASENCVGYSRFNSLPIGSDVCVVALKYDKGNTYYAVEQLKLAKQNIVSLAWKKGDKSEIEKVVEGI